MFRTLFFGAVVSTVLFSSQLGANTIFAGSSGSFTALAPGSSTGTFLASMNSPFNVTGEVGSLDSAVYQMTNNISGLNTYDFWWKANVTTGDVARVTINGFGLAASGNAFTRTDLGAGTIVPQTAILNGYFAADFGNVGSGTLINPGQSSVWFIGEFIGYGYQQTTAAIIDGGSQNVPSFTINSVPEPGSLGMVLIGAIFIVGGYHRRRRLTI